jgi:hypothetical protein
MNPFANTCRPLIPLLLAATVAAIASARADEEKKEGAKPAPPEPVELLADLRKPAGSGFVRGTWEAHVAKTASGLSVLGPRGADGSGELGEDFATPRDLSKVRFFEVALGVGLQNQVPEVTVAFDDASETQYTARIRIDQIVPEQLVWLRVRRADFKLNNWQGSKAGAAIDWTKIIRWHLQGDWSKGAPFQVMLIALRDRQ